MKQNGGNSCWEANTHRQKHTDTMLGAQLY